MKQLYYKYRELILYGIFGMLTTFVNWAVFYPLYNWLGVNKHISNIVAWVVAVAFAYITNRRYVFRSENAHTISEAANFTLSRLTSLGIEELIIFVCCDELKFNPNIIKLTAAIAVIILNYVFSKLLVFKKTK